jgi:two-component system phosphate regulon sensor histidine kinase PhoR
MRKKRYKFLIIYDHRRDQMDFKHFVREKKLPHNYTISSSVDRAGQILRKENFDLIFREVEYFISGGTAFDIPNIIIDTPIVFTKVMSSEELAAKAMKSGNDALEKYPEKLLEPAKEQTKLLTEEKELLEVILPNIKDAVIVIDTKNRITLFNKAAEWLTDRQFEEVRFKPVDEILTIINEKTQKPIENFIDMVRKSMVLDFYKIERAIINNIFISKTCVERPIDATIIPIRKNNGTITGTVILLRDVSKQREINRMRLDFIGLVSHELRTPLTSIKAYAETMLHDKNMTEETKIEFLKTINRESDRLTNLINGILEISRIESGTIEIVRRPINVSSLAKRAVGSFEHLAEKKNIHLEADIAENLPQIKGDKNKIYSMITNLIDNAIKFTPNNGKISVSVRPRNHELVIEVRDNGIGIPKEDLSKTFSRYYRDQLSETQIENTKTGLAIVNEIVLRHDGRIDVESEVHKGSTFTVYLPFTP